MLCVLLLLIFLPFAICAWHSELEDELEGNDMEGVSNRQGGLERELPAREYKDVGLRGEQTQCSICLEGFSGRDAVVVVPCEGQHVFHEKCIGRWLESQRQCPLCR